MDFYVAVATASPVLLVTLAALYRDTLKLPPAAGPIRRWARTVLAWLAVWPGVIATIAALHALASGTNNATGRDSLLWLVGFQAVTTATALTDSIAPLEGSAARRARRSLSHGRGKLGGMWTVIEQPHSIGGDVLRHLTEDGSTDTACGQPRADDAREVRVSWVRAADRCPACEQVGGAHGLD